MKGKKYLGKFAPQIEENFQFQEVSECIQSYERNTPDSGIDIHRGYYKGGGYDNIEIYVQKEEIVGVRVCDPGSGEVFLELGKL